MAGDSKTRPYGVAVQANHLAAPTPTRQKGDYASALEQCEQAAKKGPRNLARVAENCTVAAAIRRCRKWGDHSQAPVCRSSCQRAYNVVRMRRLMSLAAFALFLALPLWAQHGGGHAGGGHGGGFGGHAGFAGGHGGGFSGGHVSGGVHAGGMRTSPGAARGFSRGPAFAQRGVNHRSFGNRGFRGRRVRTFGFRNNCFGYGCRGSYFYPYAYGGYYDPWWWGDSGSSYDEDYERNRAVASEMNAQSLEEQQMLRREEQEEEAGDRI